jgi:N,N-dimethylformamidase
VTAPLTGYADRISVRAGETIAFKVSSHGSGPFSANLVRIVCGDPNPAGPGPTFEDQSTAFAGRFPSRAQHAWPGSYAIVDGAKAITLAAGAVGRGADLADPGDRRAANGAVAPRPATGAGFALVLTPEGMMLEVGDAKVLVGKPLRSRAGIACGRAPIADRHAARRPAAAEAQHAFDDEGSAASPRRRRCRSTRRSRS